MRKVTTKTYYSSYSSSSSSSSSSSTSITRTTRGSSGNVVNKEETSGENYGNGDYLYTSTCRSPDGTPCTKTYTTYKADGKDMTKTTYSTPYRNYGKQNPSPHVAAMVIVHPNNPKDTTKFEAECLDEHNLARARHGVQPLALNEKLCKYAAEWAEELAARNRLQHRVDNLYGENIYMLCGKTICGRDPVRAWYNEITGYNYKRPQFSTSTGHFTQVIWKESRRLGVGVAIKGETTYVVCNYDPPGNYAGEFDSNVPVPL